MTHPSIHARTTPDKIAYQMAATGKAITYRELDELSNQGANLFRSLGLKAGDHIALLMENRLAFMEICWAAQRSGLYYTAISRYLTPDEIAYIVKDCGAKLVISSPKCADQVKGLITDAPGEPLFYILDEPLPGFRSFDKEASVQPTTPIPDEVAGYDMLYSSGTTGRPRASRSKSSTRTTRKRPRGRSARSISPMRRCSPITTIRRRLSAPTTSGAGRRSATSAISTTKAFFISPTASPP